MQSDSKNALISVIIPCYNYGRFIGEAIESIIAQTHQNWEIIIIDDGSTDNTAIVVQAYVAHDARIMYHHQSNAGLSAARNSGLALARGKYLQLLDADDYIAPTKLAKQASQLENNPDVDLVYGDTYNFNNSADVTGERVFVKFKLTMAPISGQYTALALHMAQDNIFLVSCPLFQKKMADDVGPFNTALHSLEDWNFWCRAVLKGKKFLYNNEPGTEFYVRTHGNNMSGNRYKMWKFKIQARQSLLELALAAQAKSVNPNFDLEPIIVRHQAFLFEEQARFNLLYGDIFTGLRFTGRYFLAGKSNTHIWYDSAYWLKERLLRRNQHNS